MGEVQNDLFKPTLNRSFKVQANDWRITSDAGFLLLRKAETRLRIIERMHDPRRVDRVRYGLDELIREQLFALLSV